MVHGTITGLQKKGMVNRITHGDSKYIVTTSLLKTLHPYYYSLTIKTFEEAISNIGEISLELLKENEHFTLTEEQFQSLKLIKEMV